MAETVFVLGAGASFEAGAPLMDGFLTKARPVIAASGDKAINAAYQQLESFVVGLDVVTPRVRIPTNNIEAVLGMLEMGVLSGRLPGVGAVEPNRLLDSTVAVLSYAIEHGIAVPIWDDNGNRTLGVPPGYAGLGRLIQTLTEDRPSHSCAIITTNYDCLAELTLHTYGVPYDYCIDGGRHSASTPVLKLHGSLNWGRCPDPDCGAISAVSLTDHIGNMRSFNTPEKTARLILSARLKDLKCQTCGKQLGPAPSLVAPSWNKRGIDDYLKPIWRQAVQELAGARNVVIVGYSMPDSDLFFRYLLACGLAGGAMLDGVWVIDPGEEAQKHYMDIVGENIKRQKKLIMVKKGFGASTDAQIDGASFPTVTQLLAR
jgi:hypothetical protein